MNALEAIKKQDAYDMVYDELLIVLEETCEDAYTRGYLTHFLEKEADASYGQILFEEFYDFVLKVKQNSNLKVKRNSK